MQKLNRQIRRLFFISLALSVGFPLGVLGIVFGAVKWLIPLLVIGIVLTVGGFYAMPLLWVKYADRRHDRTLLFMIENEYIYTVSGLAAQAGYREGDVRDRIMRMIRTQILVGYLFQNDTLELNTNRRQAGMRGTTMECPNCCATMVHDGELYRCAYCGNAIRD